MHETSDFYSTINFSYTKYFVHSYTVDVVFILSYYMTYYDYITMIIVHSCIIWFHLDYIIQLK